MSQQIKEVGKFSRQVSLPWAASQALVLPRVSSGFVRGGDRLKPLLFSPLHFQALHLGIENITLLILINGSKLKLLTV